MFAVLSTWENNRNILLHSALDLDSSSREEMKMFLFKSLLLLKTQGHEERSGPEVEITVSNQSISFRITKEERKKKTQKMDRCS